MSCCSVQQASGRSRSTVDPGAATSSSLRAHCAVAADRHAGRRLADAGHELVDAIRAVELHRDSVETTAATLRARRPSSAPVSGHPAETASAKPRSRPETTSGFRHPDLGHTGIRAMKRVRVPPPSSNPPCAGCAKLSPTSPIRPLAHA